MVTLQHRSHREVVTLALQTFANLGTPTDPGTHMMPVTSFSAKENYEQLLDNGRRGPDAMDFRAVQGVKHVEITMEGVIQMNALTGSPIGMLLRSILATGTNATAYPTPIEISTNAVYKHYRMLGNEHEYLTIQHYDNLAAANFREFEGCRCTELTISFNTGEGLLTYSATLIGRNFTKETDTMDLLASQDTTLEDPFPGWQAALVFNGSANTNLISAEWSLKRSENRLYTGASSQLFKALHFGPLEATVAMVFDYSATELDLFKAGTQVEITTNFTNGLATTALRGFDISMETASLLEAPAEVDSSGETMTLALSARGLYSEAAGEIATDNSDTGAVASIQGPIETLTTEANAATGTPTRY